MIEYWGFRPRTRQKRCYELCGRAIMSEQIPPGAVLVFGHWSQFQVPHVWIELPDGRVWEPVSATLDDGDKQRAEYHLVEYDDRTSRFDRQAAAKAVVAAGSYCDLTVVQADAQ